MANSIEIKSAFPSQRHARRYPVTPTRAFVEFRKEEVEQSISRRFEEMVGKYPDRLAIERKGRTLTYDALNRLANRIAHAILARRGQKEEPIALLLQHDVDAIAGILGVLKAGKIYVPLEPSDPIARNGSMLADSVAELIVSNDHNISRLDGLLETSLQLLNIDDLPPGSSEENPGLSISSDRIAYIMYTSGSTGKPKAVMQNHRNVLHNTRIYTNNLHVSSDDRMTLLHSCSNGACINNLYGALLNGGALLPFDVKQSGVMDLAKYIVDGRITIYHSIPALFRNFVNTLTGSEDLSALRIVHLSGEAATKKDVEMYKKHFPSDCIFVHRLGCREAQTVFLHLIDKTTEIVGNIVPVGPAVEDIDVVLVDERNMPVTCNEVGEITIRGRYLAPGYWRDPERTNAAFQTATESDKRIYRTGDLGRLRPDGCYEHLGRKDSRVKIRGYRIEIAEIEITLLNLDMIKEATVLDCADSLGEKRLVAYVVPNGGSTPTVSELRRLLKERLPEYMIPSAFVLLDALPVTPTGKIDRQALPVPQRGRPNVASKFMAPRNSEEKMLAEIWAAVLAIDQVGIEDNFFDLGGHSLSAAKVLSRVRDFFDIELPFSTLFDKPTIAELAEFLSQIPPDRPVLQ